MHVNETAYPPLDAGNCDRDFFNGTAADLNAFWAPALHAAAD
jgi:hypothetical protein